MIKLPKNEGLNIIPFIDITLVLLAIVLSISTLIAYREIKIELPKSQNLQILNNNENKLVILIDKKNNFYINNQIISLNDLTKTINSLNSQTLIELKSDKEAKFESFIQIIDILKYNNHENFQIITEQK